MLIVGVGNPWRRDDGVGPAVIACLQSDPRFAHATLVDGGTDGLALLDIIQQHKHAVIIDAVNMNMSPGSIRLFSPAEVKIYVQSDALSTHGFGLAEVIAFMQKLEINTTLHIVGIQPYDISFGHGLTDMISTKIPTLISLIEGTCRGATTLRPSTNSHHVDVSSLHLSTNNHED